MVSAVGSHESCCGSNEWKVATGSPTVFINGQPAARKGDITQHCGGVGELVEGSENVLIGDDSDGERRHWIEFVLRDAAGEPTPGVRCHVELPDGTKVFAVTTKEGIVRFDGLDPGQVELKITDVVVSGED